MKEHDDCKIDLSPEEEIEIAKRAYRAKEYQHAAFHIGCALSHNPGQLEWLGFLNQLIVEVDDPLSLAELGEKNYFATVAVHAYILAKLGQINKALPLIFNVIPAKPEVAYLHWLTYWFDDDELVKQLDVKVLIQCLTIAIKQFHIISNVADPDQSNLSYLVFLIRKFRKLVPTNSEFFACSAMLLRRMGLLNEALEMAEEDWSRNPGAVTAIVLAGVLRDSNEIEAALTAFRNALTFRPDDLTVRLDIGDILMSEGRLQEAAQSYQEVLAQDGNHPWALPSNYFLQHYLAGTKNDNRSKLLAFAQQHPENQRASELANHLTPYVGYLPEATDATIDILRQMMAELEVFKSLKGDFQITVSNLEAPSAQLAFNLQLAMIDSPLNLVITATNVPKPDPRYPRKKVDYLLWRYEGTEPAPAVQLPDQHVVLTVVGLAEQQFDLKRWSFFAKQLAQHFGESDINSLLGIMVHPPRPTFAIPAWVWIQHLQLASALILSYIDQGWEGSLRKRVLFSIANGPVDWAVDAAIIALTELAIEMPEIKDDVMEQFSKLLNGMPSEGDCCYRYALVSNWLRLPGIPAELQTTLIDLQNNIENGN